jgi:hypothetical protein
VDFLTKYTTNITIHIYTLVPLHANLKLQLTTPNLFSRNFLQISTFFVMPQKVSTRVWHYTTLFPSLLPECNTAIEPIDYRLVWSLYPVSMHPLCIAPREQQGALVGSTTFLPTKLSAVDAVVWFLSSQFQYFHRFMEPEGSLPCS